MKKKFRFNRIAFLCVLVVGLCLVALTSCGSKYGGKTAYMDYSMANTKGCAGGSNVKSKADWLVEVIEAGVESSVNEYLIYIKDQPFHAEAQADIENIKLTGKFKGEDCSYIDADNNTVTTQSYIKNLDALINTYVDENNLKAIANTDDQKKINEHFQVALIKNDTNEFKGYINNVTKADKKSLEEIKISLNGTAGCFDTKSEKVALNALSKVHETTDVYLLGALYMIKVDDRLMETEPIIFKASSVGDFFAHFWNNVFIFPVAWLLYAISKLCGGYYILGLIITTLIVRTLGWPIYAKSNDLSLKMSLMQPELLKIQEKYAGRNDPDSQRMMQMEQAQLYKKNKIGIGGCLAPFLQFPIFMAIYNAISRLPYTEAIAGSRYTLNWANELKSSLFGINLFEDRNGGGINQLVGIIILVLLVVGTQVLSQFLMQLRQKKNQQKQQEDIPAYRRQSYNQSQMQGQGTMKFMLWFMIFMMGSFVWTSKAGLGMYWFIGNIYSMFQMVINNATTNKRLEKLKNKQNVYTVKKDNKNRGR